MREGTTLRWLLGDHLGSTNRIANSDGSPQRRNCFCFVTDDVLYNGWGETRYVDGSLPTTYKFTGQRQESSLGGSEGLYYYNARWYDPTLSRFAQADTVIPGGVQGLDRYAYVGNNPTNSIDPRGHRECDSEFGSDCNGGEGGNGQGSDDGGNNENDNTVDPNDWGDPTGRDNDNRMDRAENIWNMICNTSGWWNNYTTGCFKERDLIAWLLGQEAALLLNDSVYWVDQKAKILNSQAATGIMLLVTYMRYRFSDGIDPRADLGKFTSFFNPNGGSTFNSNDWNEIMTKPTDVYYQEVDRYWNSPYPYGGAELD